MTDITYTPGPAPMLMVWVQWVDAVVESNDHWISRSSFRPRDAGGLMCESCGYLMHEDDDSIVLCQSQNEGAIDNIITIPMGMVVDMRELKARRRKK